MLPPDRAQTFASAPLGELLGVLLRQLRRPLAAHGLRLTDTEAQHMGEARGNGEAGDFTALIAALAGVVTESESVLATMGVSFSESLDTPMDKIGGWETTAEFLDRANEKANAELRIALGAALLLAFGDGRFAGHLQHLAAGDYGDETVIAQRVLAFAGNPSTPSE